jgi:hypothetical protein
VLEWVILGVQIGSRLDARLDYCSVKTHAIPPATKDQALGSEMVEKAEVTSAVGLVELTSGRCRNADIACQSPSDDKQHAKLCRPATPFIETIYSMAAKRMWRWNQRCSLNKPFVRVGGKIWRRDVRTS